MAKPTRQAADRLNPKWLCDTAKLAVKRGTSIVVTKTRQVYGLLPKSGGSVCAFYKGDDAWIDAILAAFPEGAVFPGDMMYGGANASKSLKPYANIRLPEDGGGAAWIDPVTGAVHVKGVGATIHSAVMAANDVPALNPPGETEAISLPDGVTPAVIKLLEECTKTDPSRPALGRVFSAVNDDGIPFLLATDGKTAVMRECPGLPEEFSYNPDLVKLGEIVSFGIVKDEINATAIRTYELDDGVSLVEKVGDFSFPSIFSIVKNAERDSSGQFLGSLALSTLVESVKDMGLGVSDVYGGVVRFCPDGATLLSMSQEIAEFDAVADFGNVEVGAVHFAVPLLAKLAALGGGFSVCKTGGPALARNGGTTVLAMAVRLT